KQFNVHSTISTQFDIQVSLIKSQFISPSFNKLDFNSLLKKHNDIYSILLSTIESIYSHTSTDTIRKISKHLDSDANKDTNSLRYDSEFYQPNNNTIFVNSPFFKHQVEMASFLILYLSAFKIDPDLVSSALNSTKYWDLDSVIQFLAIKLDPASLLSIFDKKVYSSSYTESPQSLHNQHPLILGESTSQHTFPPPITSSSSYQHPDPSQTSTPQKLFTKSTEFYQFISSIQKYSKYISTWIPNLNTDFSVEVFDILCSIQNKKDSLSTVKIIYDFSTQTPARFNKLDPSFNHAVSKYKYKILFDLLCWIKPINHKNTLSNQTSSIKQFLAEIQSRTESYSKHKDFNFSNSEQVFNILLSHCNISSLSIYSEMIDCYNKYSVLLFTANTFNKSVDPDQPVDQNIPDDSIPSDDLQTPIDTPDTVLDPPSSELQIGSPEANTRLVAPNPQEIILDFCPSTQNLSTLVSLFEELVSPFSKNHNFNILSQTAQFPNCKALAYHIAWEMPIRVFGKTLLDAQVFITTLAILSLSDQHFVINKLPKKIVGLCDSWHNVLFPSSTQNPTPRQIADFIFPICKVKHPNNHNLTRTQFESNWSVFDTLNVGNSSDENQPKGNPTAKNNNLIQETSFEKDQIGISTRKKWKWETVELRRKESAFYNQKIKPVKENLPASNYANVISEYIVNAIFSSYESRFTPFSNILLVQGDTGCGKSTQIPQILLEALLKSKNYNGGRIICTQPRKVSAVSIAERVSLELSDPLQSKIGGKHNLVGSHTHLNPQHSNPNILVFCTTGILIQQLKNNPNLVGISAVIIDEVQDRTIEVDFLLAILKNLVQKRTDLFVVLMSATINAEHISKYFTGCRIFKIPGRTFLVDVHYIEDIIQCCNYRLGRYSEYAITERFNFRNRRLNHTGSNIRNNLARANTSRPTLDETGSLNPTTLVQDTMSRMAKDVVNLELIHILIKNIIKARSDNEDNASILSTAPKTGAILVFLPGIKDISKLATMILCDRELDNIIVIKLHSTTYSPTAGGNKYENYQTNPFLPTPPRKTKVVLSTNIAETGITIPDVTIVIDCGRSKQVSFDHESQVSIMKEKFISQASAKQRMGRAGRVQNGVCFRMYTKTDLESWPSYDAPEITFLPLQSLCLNIKKMYPNISLFSFFNTLLDRPPQSLVETSIFSLVGFNLLEHCSLSDKHVNPASIGTVAFNLNLTPLGVLISSLSLDISLARMLVFGVMLRCLDPVLTLVSALSQPKSIFASSDNVYEMGLDRIFDYGISFDLPYRHLKFGEKFSISDYLPTLEDLKTQEPHYSDFVSIVKAYNEWRYISSCNGITRKDLLAFCKIRKLNLDVLETVEDAKEKILRSLVYLRLLRRPSSRNGFGSIVRKVQPEVTGYQSGHVLYNPTIYENKNSSNVAIFSCAVVAGLDTFLIPDLNSKQSGKAFTNYISVIPNSITKGCDSINEDLQNITTRVSNKRNLGDFGDFGFPEGLNDDKQKYRMHISSVNKNLFTNNIVKKDLKALRFAQNPQEFVSNGLLLCSHLVQKVEKATYLKNTCTVPLLTALLFSGITPKIECPIKGLFSIKNGSYLFKSQLKNVYLIKYLSYRINRMWERFVFPEINFSENLSDQDIFDQNVVETVTTVVLKEYKRVFNNSH
ncbi:hypothetical protein BB560_000945, partial [Smittium megazygosporum]